MDKKDLLKAIGDIDDKFIEEAANLQRKKKKVKIWQNRALMSAASVFICFGVGFYIFQNTDLGAKTAKEDSADLAREEITQDFVNQETVTENGMEDYEQEAAEDYAMDSADSYFDDTAGENFMPESNGIEEYIRNPQSVTKNEQEVTQSASSKDEYEEAEALPENQKELYVSREHPYAKYVNNLSLPEGFTLLSLSDEGDSLVAEFGKDEAFVEITFAQADEDLSDFLAEIQFYKNHKLEESLADFNNIAFYDYDISVELLEYRVKEEDGIYTMKKTGVVYSDMKVLEFTSVGLTPEELYELMIFENN